MNKKYLYRIGAPVVWIGVFLLVLMLKGYQSPQKAFNSEKEKEEQAIKYALQCVLVKYPAVIQHNSLNKSDFDDKFLPAYMIPYKDIQHFLSENPNCCKRKGNEFLIKGKIYYSTPIGVIYRETKISEFYLEPYLVSTSMSCY